MVFLKQYKKVQRWVGYLYTCLIQEVWQATASHQQPSLQWEVWMLGISECSVLTPQHPWGRGGIQVLSKGKHTFPWSHIFHKEMSERGDFQPLPTSSLTLPPREMTCFIGEFGYTGLTPSGISWGASLATWLLHSGLSPWYDNLSRQVSAGGKFNLWGRWGVGFLAIALATDLKQSCKSVIKLTFTYKTDILIFICFDILIFICLSLCLHSYIVWT